MEPLIRLFTALTPAAWVAATAAYLMVFVRQDAGAERWAPRIAWTAVAIQVAGLGVVGMAGICPMLVPASVVSELGLAVGVIHLCVEGRAKNRAMGLFPMAAAAIFCLAAAAADPMRRPDPSIPLGTTALHVTGAILSYAGLLLAALFGALYLVQQRALKEKRFGLFWERLPSLELLDQFSRHALFAGVLFLTVTIAFGHVVRRGVAPDETYWDAKIVATNLLWLMGLAVVVARRFDKLRPQPAAVASVVLFVLAMANFVVVDMFSRVHRGI